MSNEIQQVSEQNKVTEKLLLDYLTTLTDKLNDSERMQFLAVSQAYNLNPFKREIYAVLYVGKDGKRNFSIIVGYETYLKRAEEFPQYDGYETEFGVANNDLFCKCHVYRKDRSHAVTSTVWLSEYTTQRNLWLSKPKVMLEKVAICTAFRRAFPSEYGGMPYAPEELSTSTEEQLKAQGMTEAKIEEPKAEKMPLTEEQKAENFKKAMRKLHDRNPEVYDAFMGLWGFSDENMVAPNERKSTFDAMAAEIAKAEEDQNETTTEKE